MKEFTCPVCGQPLEAVSYTSKRVTKSKLWCSNPTARLQEDHKAVVYYPSKNGEFWSFGLKAKPQGSQPPSPPPRSHRRKQKRHNRQRQLSL